MKNIRVFLSENFHILVAKFSVYVNRHVLVMVPGSVTAMLDFVEDPTNAIMFQRK